jgi:hypothetical protein
MSIVSRAAFFFASGSLAAFPAGLGGILVGDFREASLEMSFCGFRPFALLAVAVVVWGKGDALFRVLESSLLCRLIRPAKLESAKPVLTELFTNNERTSMLHLAP